MSLGILPDVLSMSELNEELLILLKIKDSEQEFKTKFDELVQKYSLDRIVQWENKKSNFIHELVLTWQLNLVKDLSERYNLNINLQHRKDLCTPIHLASWHKNVEMYELLRNLGADRTIKNKYCELPGESILNIIWLDLELTSLHDPQILECAVIITDKDLNELERGQWVVHFEQKDLNDLDEWHKKTFKSVTDGGNGLFDAVVKSIITKEQMESELLQIIEHHCPKKCCPLAGSSIHTDREVIKLRMPTVYDYLHHRIIDVSSISGVMQRWSPTKWFQMKNTLNKTSVSLNHRAMNDIERSVEILKLIKPLLCAQ
ncbi:unnamed protein product [Didymodactylos carnosus]|uniref:Exonuclease domain-containing protein n=1 Tax=Didymodactylos carnosus TaxID=1234261 RepID=A0A815ZH62_9BILA|nr:unnamed protein product [Didymodactylos carnosus]CAF1582736.1 unnamed protein product [Didymodactylos carnosus]CAF4153239.1 unnamed protein product [Didymodactylos carnosus]CAF4450844.1 unnamed protein product [Didymodactylos carnosus]